MGWYFTKDAPPVYGMKERTLSKQQLAEHKAQAQAGQGMHIDQWGRLMADPTKWPDGIKGAAKMLHALGIKMGIHIMRGINTAAVAANSPILDMSTGKGAHHSTPLPPSWRWRIASIVASFRGFHYQSAILDVSGRPGVHGMAQPRNTRRRTSF
jgi:hypothetical protein